MGKITSLTGPLERSGEQWLLRLPLDAGGDRLMACCRGISTVENGFLCIEILDWLAAKLEISEGSLVTVHNTDGKFNITPALPNE